MEFCPCTCEHNNELIIKTITTDGMKLIVTNADNVTLTCIGNEFDWNFELVGAVQLNINCRFEVFINNLPLRKPFPCVEKRRSSFDINAVLPFMM